MPWGVLGYVAVTTSQTGITTITDLTSLTLTVTLTANRYVRTSLYIPQAANTNANNNNACYITDGSNNIKQISTFTIDAANGAGPIPVFLIETTTAGSFTRKARAACTGGAMSIAASGTQPNYLMIEDIGPSGAPA